MPYGRCRIAAVHRLFQPQQRKVPHNYSQLYALLCKPVGEVCRVLELDEEAVASAVNKRETYTIGTVEYAGFDWDVELLLDGKTPAVYGFQYIRHYDGNNIEQAAKDAVSLVKQMEKHYGAPSEYGTLGIQTAFLLTQDRYKTRRPRRSKTSGGVFRLFRVFPDRRCRHRHR